MALAEGLHACDRVAYDAAEKLAETSGEICRRLPDSPTSWPLLVEALTAAYHLGRRHTLERVAIGLAAEEE